MKKIIQSLLLVSLILILPPKAAFSQDGNPAVICFDAIEANPSLQALKGKVSLSGRDNHSLVLLTNTRKPSATEKSALEKWDALRSECIKASKAWSATYEETSDYANRKNALEDKLINNVKILIAELHSGKITYGEFSKLRIVNADSIKAESLLIDQQNAQQEQRQREVEEQNEIAQQQLAAQRSATMLNTLNQIQTNSILQQQNNALQRQANKPTPPAVAAPRGQTQTNCIPNGYGVTCTSY